MEKGVKEIVITGGPCSGKTTAINYFAGKLRTTGLEVFIVREAATDIIKRDSLDVVVWLKKNDPVGYLKFQKDILLKQRLRRKRARARSSKFPKGKCVILFDRAEMDNKAYMQEGQFEVFLEEEGLTLDDVRDSYDGVVHLVTAAKGAERFYTTKNNKSRHETLAEAREADERILAAWIGHSHLRIVDNSTDFEGKKRRALRAINGFLGIPAPIEIERKFLLRAKPSFRLKALRNAAKIFIEQIYLVSPRGQPVRIRKRSQGNSATYCETQKLDISPGIRHEVENFISASEYLHRKSLRDPSTQRIRKHRYYFVYKNQYFELDVFIEPKRIQGLCLLEIELTEKNEHLELPPFLDIEKEVTDDPAFSNFEIARKK